MNTSSKHYSDFVEHPRYGRMPRETGLNPQPNERGSIYLHWHSPKKCRVPNTAIAARVSLQRPSVIPITHYFDVIRVCRDCGRPFLFFAEEQRHWYEELGFGLDADCVRCVPCRKKQKGIARQKERYEELFHVPQRSTAKTLEMAECSLALIEAGTFSQRQTERIRAMLHMIPDNIDEEMVDRIEKIWERLRLIELTEEKNRKLFESDSD